MVLVYENEKLTKQDITTFSKNIIFLDFWLNSIKEL